jgi:hypothetical protein
MRTDDAKAILTELFSPGRTDKKGDIAPGLGESAAKVATNCADADNKDSHSHASIASTSITSAFENRKAVSL